MRFSHFSPAAWTFDPNFVYQGTGPHSVGGMKPCGLWLSDESDYGWKRWCEDSQFRKEGFVVEKFFEVDLSRAIVLNWNEAIREFSEEYDLKKHGYEGMYLDWPRVYKKYSGIVITPYQFSSRMEYLWYYGWDCASACIWDLSTLREVIPYGK